MQIHSLYLHFPHCRHLCNYCDFFKTQREGDFQSFHRWLEEAQGHHKELLRQQGFSLGKLKTLYFGGGTPSLWGREGAQFFGQFLQRQQIVFDSEYEWTMELNPGSWQEWGMKEWMDLGVNRFSVGVQSLCNKYLEILDRVHRQDEVLETLKFLQRQEVNYSVDFMIGLPFSAKYNRQILEELERILDYGPQHISVYILTVPKQYVHFQHLPSEEFIRQEYLAVSKYLQERGMIHYEVSNYAHPGRESTHNFQYWAMESVAAIGPSATGLLVKNSQHALRYKWHTQAPQFTLGPLTPEQIKLEQLYMLMRTNSPLDPRQFFNNAEQQSWEQLVKAWDQRGYLLSTRPFRMGSKGYLMLDSLMGDIFSAISQ